MSLDPEAATSSITAKLTTLVVNCRIVEEEATTPVDSNGIVQPHFVLRFGGPIRSARGRGITGSAKDPHLMWVTFHCVASTVAAAKSLRSQALGLIDFCPTGSGPMTLEGGYSEPTNSDAVPQRHEAILRFSYTINM